MESGLRIVDAPNYLLYKNPEHYLRTKLLPVKTHCKCCESDLVVDLVSDVRWAELIYDHVEYQKACDRVTRERDRSFMTMPDNLERHYPYPKKESFGSPTFYSYCPICSNCVTYSFDLSDIEPIKKFVIAQQETAKKKTKSLKNIVVSERWKDLFFFTVCALIACGFIGFCFFLATWGM